MSGWDPRPISVVGPSPSSTPSSGRRLFWSSVYSRAKAGAINSAARTAATSTAMIVPGRSRSLRHRQRLGQQVVPLGNPPREDGARRMRPKPQPAHLDAVCHANTNAATPASTESTTRGRALDVSPSKT